MTEYARSCTLGFMCEHEQWVTSAPDSVSIRCPQCADEISVSPAFAAHRRAIDREIERLSTRDEAKREYAAIFRDPPKDLTFVGAETDLTEADEGFAWLIEPILNKGAFVLLTAQAKVGKTTFVVSALTALLRGESFLGWKVADNYARSVAYLNLDMTPQLFRYYAEPIGAPDTFKVLHGASGRYDVNDATFTEPLARELREMNAGILVVDVWSSIYSGDESDNSETARAVGALMQLREETDLDAIILLHHAGWSGSNRARGASSIEGKVDILWRLDSGGDNRSRFYVDRSRIGKVPRVEVVYDPARRTISLGGSGVPGSSAHEAAERRRLASVASKAKLRKALETSPEGCSRTHLQDTVGGNAGQLRIALQEMVAEGEVLESAGHNGPHSKLYTLAAH